MSKTSLVVFLVSGAVVFGGAGVAQAAPVDRQVSAWTAPGQPPVEEPPGEQENAVQPDSDQRREDRRKAKEKREQIIEAQQGYRDALQRAEQATQRRFGVSSTNR